MSQDGEQLPSQRPLFPYHILTCKFRTESAWSTLIIQLHIC
jgi:hypothetical protein